MSNYCGSCSCRFGDTRWMGVNMCEGCEHLVHDTEECKGGICRVCGVKVEKYLSLNDLDENDQRYIDILSMTRKKHKFSLYRHFIAIIRIFMVSFLMIDLFLRSTFDNLFSSKLVNKKYLVELKDKLLDILCVKIKVYNYDKINELERCIIICNHSSYLDLLVVASVSDEIAFVADQTITTLQMGRAIIKNYPCVILNNKDGFNKIKNFSETQQKLLICPEGMLTHERCIGKFRNTAFNLNLPIRPLVIDYAQNVFDFSNYDLFCNKNIHVNVTVMELEQTNGTPNSIENIRQKMANQTFQKPLKLSRIQNKHF